MVGFNSGKYDLNLIKKYFVTQVGGEKAVTVAKKQEKIMFLPTPNFADFEDRLWTKQWFGFAEVDISVPNELWDKFEKLPPLFTTLSPIRRFQRI